MRRDIRNKKNNHKYRMPLIYKYGSQVPRDVKEVITIDEGNKKSL